MKFPGLIALVAAVHIGAQSIPVEERTLPNGMRLLMVERPGEGSIVCAWVAKVGSAHDGLDTTGLAHMLEHMMFKGTRTLGTRNAVRDQELNAQQDTLQKQIRKELEPLREQQRRGLLSDPSDPKARTPRMQELQEAFDKAVQEQKGLAVRNELRTLYTRYGATRMNAGTGSDWTVYMVNVPANKLELWCWLESDRLRDPVFREFYTEREVVREERRTSVEGDPTGEVFESFGAMIWQAHPYQWTMFSAIGWPAPLGQLSREQAERFFRTYYAPNNITAILVGDFRAAEAAPMVEAYFGRIPANPEGVPPLVSVEPPQLGEQRMNATAAVPPAITVAWKAVPGTHRDVPALKVIERLLNG
ncbi:MAG: M16 family metallopeptidase, partial [Geothrix sp.]